MWLLYLRFDNKGEVNTYHVTAASKEVADQVFHLAEQRGLTASSRLVEYAFLYTRGTVKPKQVPNFHFYRADDFMSRWKEADDRSEET